MKFKRMNENGSVLGVCSGLAYFLKMQTWIIRAAVLLLAICGFGVFLYLVVGLLAPKYEIDPIDYKEICE